METLSTENIKPKELNDATQSSLVATISVTTAPAAAKVPEQFNQVSSTLSGTVPEYAKQSTSNMSTSSSSSTTAATSATPKVSMMSKTRLNFVIPKNKLSGALVPVTRSTTKWEPVDPSKDSEPKQPSRKTKWGPDLTQDPAVKKGRALALQTRVEQLAAQLESGNLDIDNNETTRSPSPPPLYDPLGHRINTREGRKREQLDMERREAIGECIKLNSSYKPPSGYKPVPKEAKLFIPVKEHPGYNFIGLILGPRGNTQKRMEAETGAKITIRGKGAVKEGKLPVRHGKEMDGSFEDLHVHISGDTFQKVDAAVAIIESLLIPVDEERNMHKMKQLRELAEMNGTVRDFTRVCSLCGDVGHREWQCPRDKLQTFQAKVICRLCGDGGHPTFDCPLKVTGEGKVMDKEYLNFLEELGTGLGGIDASKTGTDTSQPMLLTASGAQPMPSIWMASGNESTSGANNVNTAGAPRFPFPFPPGSDGMNALNFLIPRLFHPTYGIFRGRPFSPPGLPMMARMLSAFRGRFPFPPLGLRPDMRPPLLTTASEGLASNLPADISVIEDQAQAAASHSNSASNSFTDKENQNVPPNSSVSTAFPSITVPTVSSAIPPGDTTGSSFMSPTPNSLPTVVPPVPPIPVRPVIPSVRPVFPSIRPAVQQGSSFTQFGPGQMQYNGTTNDNNFTQPSQQWTRIPNWGHAQHSQPVGSSLHTSALETPSISRYTPPQSYPTVNTPSVLRPWSNTAGSGMTQAVRPPIVLAQFHPFTANSTPSPVPPRFPLPQVSQGQFAMPVNDRLTHHSMNYNPHSGLPAVPGPNRLMPNTIPQSPFPQHTSISQHRFSYQPQGTSLSSNAPRGPTFSTPDFSFVRPQVPPFGVSGSSQRPFAPPNISAHFSEPDSISVPHFRGARNFNLDNNRNLAPISSPAPVQGHRINSSNESWGAFPVNPNNQHMGPRPQLHSSVAPQTHDTDPEYENLMASVGVV